MTTTRTDLAAEGLNAEDLQRPKLEISTTQITTGVVASTASAILGSTLGIAGTLLGAAAGAVVYAIAAALYTHSVATTKHRLRLARLAHGNPTAYDVTPYDVTPVETPTGTDVLVPDRPERPSMPRVPRVPRPQGPSQWRSVLAGALGSAVAFALALILVTGLESAKGAPLSGGTDGGWSLLGGSAPAWSGGPASGQAESPAESPAQSPAVTVTETSVSTSVATTTVGGPGPADAGTAEGSGTIDSTSEAAPDDRDGLETDGPAVSDSPAAPGAPSASDSADAPETVVPGPDGESDGTTDGGSTTAPATVPRTTGPSPSAPTTPGPSAPRTP